MSQLHLLLQKPIAYHRILVTVTGSVTGAVLLGQAIYWQTHGQTDSDGWWWKTAEQWDAETGLSRRELETSRKSCSGFLEHKRCGVPCKSFYRVRLQELNETLQKLTEQTSMAESAKLDCTKPPNKDGGNGQSTIEKTTQETTEKTTSGMTAEPSVNAVVDAWNRCAETSKLPKIKQLTNERIRHLKARLSEQFWRDNWPIAIEKVMRSGFCKGVNDRGWKANIDWFLRPNSVAKAIEGFYDDRKANGSESKRLTYAP